MMNDRARLSAMTAEELLQQAASIVAGRRGIYGEPVELFQQVARRWSLVLGIRVTPAQAMLVRRQNEWDR
jgi:Domain of unknown function (DUF6378)